MSSFANVVEVERKPINPPTGSIADEMEEKYHSASDRINVIVREFNEIFNGTEDDLYDLAIKPMSGDFNKVEANGQAWRNVGEMFYAVQQNLKANALSLVDPEEMARDRDWSGRAARAFLEHIDLGWVAGLYVAGRVSVWMAKGFEKLAEVARDLATKCATVFRSLIDRIVRLAGRVVIPVVGQLVAVFDWILNGFDLDHAPYIGDINMIIKLIDQIKMLKERMTELVSAILDFVEKGFREAVKAIELIPVVEAGGATVKGVGAAYGRGAEKVKEHQESIEEMAERAGEDLRGMAELGEVHVETGEKEIWVRMFPFRSREECEQNVVLHMNEGYECTPCRLNDTGQWEYELKEK